MAIHLVATTQTLIIAMAESPTTQPSFIFNAGDRSTGVEPAVQLGTLTDAADTTVVSAPASGEQRLVMNGYVTNLDAAVITLTPKIDDSGTQNDFGTYTVNPGESLVFDGTTWQVVVPADSLNDAFQEYPSQGRLTLTSGTAITTSDVTAATTWYFTPYKGNRIALYDTGNSKWKRYTFSEISLAVVASTDTNYDLFIYDNSGTLTLEAVAWTNDTTRATAISLQDGVYCKSGSLDRRYLGSVRTTGTSGQCEDSESRRFVWNYYNRVSRSIVAQTTTGNWSYTTATWRAANADTTVGITRVECIVGVQENTLHCEVAVTSENTAVSSTQVSVGIGISSTTTNSAKIFGTLVSPRMYHTCKYEGHPGLGYFYLQWLEVSAAAGTTFWFGTQATTILQSGLLGRILA